MELKTIHRNKQNLKAYKNFGAPSSSKMIGKIKESKEREESSSSSEIDMV